MRVDERRADLEHALHDRCRLRRILVCERARRAHERRHPVRVGLQRDLIRLQRLAVLRLLPKEVAPRRIDRGIVGRGRRGVAIRGVRVVKASERAERARAARELHRVVARVGNRRDSGEETRRIRLAEHLLQQPELQRRFARRQTRRDGPQHRLRLRVAPALDRRLRFHRDDVRVARVQFVGDRIDFVVARVDERAHGALQRRRRTAARRLGRPRRGQCEEHQRGGKEERASEQHRDSYYI